MMVATEGMGPIARKLVGMGFTVMNAKQIVELSKDLLEEKDPGQRMEKGTQLLLLLEMMISEGKGKKGKKTVGEGEGQRPQSGTTEEPLPSEAGGEPQLQTGEPRLPAKDSGGDPQQKTSLPAKPQAPVSGAEVMATAQRFQAPKLGPPKPTMPETAGVGAEGLKGRNVGKDSEASGEVSSHAEDDDGESPNPDSVPDQPKASLPPSGGGKGGSSAGKPGTLLRGQRGKNRS